MPRPRTFGAKKSSSQIQSIAKARELRHVKENIPPPTIPKTHDSDPDALQLELRHASEKFAHLKRRYQSNQKAIRREKKTDQ